MIHRELFAEHEPTTEYFTDTDVPRITLVDDEEVLSLLLVPGSAIDQPLVDRMNEEVEVAHGGAAALDRVAQIKQLDSTYSNPYKSHFSSHISPQVEMQKAKSRFYTKWLGVEQPDSPLGPIKYTLQGIAPSSFIAMTRLIHSYAGNALPVILDASPNLLLHGRIAMQRKFELAEAEGASVREILIHNPTAFTYRDVGVARSSFVQRLHSVGTVSPAVGNVAKRLRTLNPVSLPSVSEQSTYTDTQREQLRSLADLTNLSDKFLAQGVPALLGLDEAQARALTLEILPLVEQDHEVRLRDVIRALGKVTNRAE